MNLAPQAFAADRPSSRPPSSADAGAVRATAVRQLRLTDFRNYRYLRLDLAEGCVVLTGDNGAGKTNLLEAVSFLVPGRGLRRARLDDVARRASDHQPAAGWSVAATLDGRKGRMVVGTGVIAGTASGETVPAVKRSVRIDGRSAASQLELADHVGAVWLTPQNDRLFLEGPGNRRRFLDRMVAAFAPGHAGDLAAYENAMRQRARLLAEDRRDDAWFAALEDAMARHGVAVAATRADLVARLDAAARLGVGPFPRAALRLAGEVDDWLASQPAADVEEALRLRLARQRGLDAQIGTTASGPHRSDLIVHHLDRDIAAAEGSTGEQKAMLVAIVLAHARLVAAAHGQAPLLLLDEIAAHLDAARRAALFAELRALGAQAWLSGTDRELFLALDGEAQFCRVAAGELYPG